MAIFKDIVQKAFYLGVGLAEYAAERAGTRLQEIRSQAQKLADEMVARGEMTTEEARKFVDDLVTQAQQQTVEQTPPTSAQTPEQTKEPRRIEIIADDEEPAQKSEEDDLRQQVQSLQEELRRLNRT